MTDEEMAEEYCNKLYAGKIKNEDYDEYGHLLYRSKEIREAFLAGLKAGRPQWHDLRKDPDDLPKEHISVLVMLEYGVPYISFVSTDKRWFCTDYYTGEDKVIAWCEIPTFDKE